MIVRILGEGQLDVPEAHLEALNALDDDLAAACESGDEARFRTALAALLGQVRRAGSAVADDSLAPSDLVLPGADAALDDIRGLLGDEGLIPG